MTDPLVQVSMTSKEWAQLVGILNYVLEGQQEDSPAICAVRAIRYQILDVIGE